MRHHSGAVFFGRDVFLGVARGSGPFSPRFPRAIPPNYRDDKRGNKNNARGIMYISILGAVTSIDAELRLFLYI